MLSGKAVSFVGANEETMESLTETDMTAGAYPSLPDEALLNENTMGQLGLSIGDYVTVTVPDGSQKQYRITGTLADMGSMLKADICGMALCEEGFLAIADENAADGTTYRIQFKSGAHIQEAIKEIKAQLGLSDGQISENTALLGLMGQSESNIMQALYLVAAILAFQVMVVFLDQGMPALAPWAGEVSVTGVAGLEPSIIEEIEAVDGVKRAFGRMEYGGLSISSDTESGTATLVSYEENQFKWAKEELNGGNINAVSGGAGDILVSYRDGMQWKVGDTVTLHTPFGEKQVRIVGILSSTNASSEAGSLGYIICSEQLFTESIGAASYAAVDI